MVVKMRCFDLIFLNSVSMVHTKHYKYAGYLFMEINITKSNITQGTIKEALPCFNNTKSTASRLKLGTVLEHALIIAKLRQDFCHSFTGNFKW